MLCNGTAATTYRQLICGYPSSMWVCVCVFVSLLLIDTIHSSVRHVVEFIIPSESFMEIEKLFKLLRWDERVVYKSAIVNVLCVRGLLNSFLHLCPATLYSYSDMITTQMVWLTTNCALISLSLSCHTAQNHKYLNFHNFNIHP